MSNNMRYLYGDKNEVSLPVDSGTVIEIGDLCIWETDDVRNAASISDQGTEAQNKAYISARFIGVAMSASASGETDPVRVARSGVFRYPLDAAAGSAQATFTAVEPGADADGGVDQQVELGSTSPIGRLVENIATGATEVKIEIYNTKNPYVTAS